MHINTAIVDLDLPFGTLGLDFNEEPGQGVADALSAPERLDDVLLDRLLLKGGEHLSLFTAPALLERDYDAEPEAYEAVIDAVRKATPCVIVDLPHAWSPWVRQTLLAADEIVIVATPDLASLRNAKTFADLLKQNRPNDAPPKLVLNQVGVPKRPEIPVEGFRRNGRASAVADHAVRSGAVRNRRQQRPDAGRTAAALGRAPKASRTLAELSDRPRRAMPQPRVRCSRSSREGSRPKRCSASAAPLLGSSSAGARPRPREPRRAPKPRHARADAEAPAPVRAASTLCRPSADAVSGVPKPAAPRSEPRPTTTTRSRPRSLTR